MHPFARHHSVSDDIEISDVIIRASAAIASITLSIGTEFKRVFYPLGKSKEATVALAPDRPALPPSTPLIIKVNMDKFIHNLKSKKIEIRRQDMSNASTVVTTNKREYRTTVNGIEVTVWFIVPPQPEIIPLQTSSSLQTTPEVENTDLRSTTDQIFEICPRFRVLVIGRTGAGKTSLIEKTFGVQGLHVSHNEVGECDINQELSADDENKRFVIHDSKGFEPGDKDNFNTVMKFLNERKRKPDIKDRVHAVWLCFTIPVSADRLLEKGTEKFLQSLSEGELDGLPIIAIFTKFDRLVNPIRLRNSHDFPELDEKVAKERAYNEAKNSLYELCFKPFREQVVRMTRNIPEIAVSIKEDYKGTLNELTQLTTQVVGDYVTEEVAMLSAIAQQVNPDMKIDAVIAIGRKRYWKGLAAAVASDQRQIVLQNIHEDIVRVWNLNDPREFLDSDDFKTRLVAMISEEDILTMKNITTDLSILGVLAGIIGALAGPAAPIVIPIAAAAVVGHWTILLYRQANLVLQQVMNYIVALAFIMHIIFAITTGTNNVVSRRLIKLALKTFRESPQRRKIHSEIKEHLKPLTAPFVRDAALAKLTELIEKRCITLEEMDEVKKVVRNFDVETDEPWDVTSS